MSFEVFLACYDSGNPAGIARAAIRGLFPIDAGHSEPNWWHVRYDKRNSCDLILTNLPGDQELVASIGVHRPCSDIRLWKGLLALMQIGNIVLFWPGDAPPLVANESAVDHLPKSMIASLGQPRCVASAEEIVEIVEHS